MRDISEEIKQFVFSQIDSVEQLEVILLLRLHREKWWSARAIADDMRTSVSSISNRLNIIESMGLAEKDSAGSFRYKPKDIELERLMDQLAENYKVRKHRVFELIFSPMKKARNFADAFLISGKKDEEGDG